MSKLRDLLNSMEWPDEGSDSGSLYSPGDSSEDSSDDDYPPITGSVRRSSTVGTIPSLPTKRPINATDKVNDRPSLREA